MNESQHESQHESRHETAGAREMFVFAVVMARTAPSIFNTQPWAWSVHDDRLELRADRDRQLRVVDPEGRLLTLSCGAALHHARIALSMCGRRAQLSRLPDPADPDLLAVIRITEDHRLTVTEINAFAGIGKRRTDRRPFTDEPVDPAVWRRLVASAEHEGAHLHVVTAEQLPVLAAAAEQAAALEMSDPDYRRELAAWTHRPAGSGDGVDPGSAAPAGPRAVPVRDFAPFGVQANLLKETEPGTDRGAGFAIVFTDEDSGQAWLRAGEALSAVLLEAASTGLGTAPISDITELAVTREQLRRQLLAGLGHPQIALRIGHPAPGSIPQSARRDLSDLM